MDDTPGPTPAEATREALRQLALSLPGAYEEFPWGESVAKVSKKVFVFFGRPPAPGQGLGLSVKLPHSGADVLALPFAEPTGYGLGQHGWVTLRFLPEEQPPLDVLRGWVLESYRAVAPKRLAAQLDRQTEA